MISPLLPAALGVDGGMRFMECDLTGVNREVEGSISSPEEILSEAIGEIYRGRMTTTSGGNFSLRDRDDAGALWITPAGVDKGNLTPEDMIRVLADGSWVGEHRPSSEFPIHRSIYQKRPDVMAVIHAHPPALVAYALARKSPDLQAIPQIQDLCGPVGYADYRLPGSAELGDVISLEFERGANVVVMENHGVAVAGRSMREAFLRLTAAEFCAQAIIDAARLGPPKSAGAEAQRRDQERLSSGQTEDMVEKKVEELQADVIATADAVRVSLAELVQRACRQGLMPRSCGSVSQRLGGGDFMITPHAMLRPGVRVEDMVWMRGRACVNVEDDASTMPSRSWALHEEIYRTHPEVNSIIITQAPAVMAHAVAQQRLDVTSNPESWVFVREVAQLPYGSQVANEDGVSRVAQALGPECPVVLIDNEAIVVTGGPLMQTFDRLEVSEFTAQSILLAKSIGSAVDMESEKITELRQAFCS